MNESSSVNHENIARRAHQIWEAAGRPDSDELAHWLQAERELRAHGESAGEVKGDRRNSVEPPPSGKHAPEHSPHSSNYVHPGVTTDSLHHARH
jgi:hypothetical protein